MKLLLIIIMLILLALGLYPIADARILQLPEPKRMVQLPKIQNNQKHNAAPAVETYLGEFRLSRYYNLNKGQTIYYTSYKADLKMNCNGGLDSCATTANGHILDKSDIGTLYSCPKEIKLGTKIKLVFRWGEVYGVCHDRGGSIKGKRLDSYCGEGDLGVNNIKKGKGCYTGLARIYIIE